LSDDFIAEAGADVVHLHGAAIAAIKRLNKFTHVRPGSLVTNPAEIAAFVDEALSALLGLFESFAECRGRVAQAVERHVDREALEIFVYETVQKLDELASHHTINEAYVSDVEITDLTDSMVLFRAEGVLSVQLQWGSGADLRRGDGATHKQSFPFVLMIASPVSDVRAFSMTEYVIDTEVWFKGDE
jgi:hypothetical protein